jgi:hypothetical protein
MLGAESVYLRSGFSSWPVETPFLPFGPTDGLGGAPKCKHCGWTQAADARFCNQRDTRIAAGDDVFWAFIRSGTPLDLLKLRRIPETRISVHE